MSHFTTNMSISCELFSTHNQRRGNVLQFEVISKVLSSLSCVTILASYTFLLFAHTNVFQMLKRENVRNVHKQIFPLFPAFSFNPQSLLFHMTLKGLHFFYRFHCSNSLLFSLSFSCKI